MRNIHGSACRHKLNPLFISSDAQRAPMVDLSGRKTRANMSRSNSIERTTNLLGSAGAASEEDEEDRREAVEKNAKKVAEWEAQGGWRPSDAHTHFSTVL